MIKSIMLQELVLEIVKILKISNSISVNLSNSSRSLGIADQLHRLIFQLILKYLGSSEKTQEH